MYPTNRVDLEIYSWAHDFVPSVDAPDQPPASFEAAGSTERMGERGIGCEIALDCCALEGRR